VPVSADGEGDRGVKNVMKLPPRARFSAIDPAGAAPATGRVWWLSWPGRAQYIAHFPAAGEVVIFDRSWYNRAGAEPVTGLCAPAETGRFFELVPGVEKAMAGNGILLLTYWLEVRPRRADPAAGGPDPRPAEDLEAAAHGPEVLQPLV
jgi:Polyphosphate kinase 2 (PPK2)